MLSISAMDIPLSSTWVRPLLRGLRLRLEMPKRGERPFCCMRVSGNVLPSAEGVKADRRADGRIVGRHHAWYEIEVVATATHAAPRSTRCAVCRADAEAPRESHGGGKG